MRPCLYRPEVGDGRGTRGVAITALAEVGGGRSAAEASPLTRRRVPKRRLEASPAAPQWRRRIDEARGSLPCGAEQEKGGHAQCPCSVSADASEAQIWAEFASTHTLRSFCVGPLERGAGPKIDRPDENGRFKSVCVGPLEMPLLIPNPQIIGC